MLQIVNKSLENIQNYSKMIMRRYRIKHLLSRASFSVFPQKYKNDGVLLNGCFFYISYKDRGIIWQYLEFTKMIITQ